MLICTVLFTSMCVVPEDLQTTTEGINDNSAPVIVNYSPAPHVINITLSDSDPPEEVDFSIDAQDPDGDILSYKWEVLDCNGSSCEVKIGATDRKSYKYHASLPVKDVIIGVEVSDSVNNVYHYWILKIQRIF